MNEKYAPFCTLFGRWSSTPVTSVRRGRNRPAALSVTVLRGVAGASEARSDFQLYAERIKQQLCRAGINFQVVCAHSFHIGLGAGTTVFYPKTGIGYRWLISPRKIAGTTSASAFSASNSLNPVTSELGPFFSGASSNEPESAGEFPMHATGVCEPEARISEVNLCLFSMEMESPSTTRSKSPTLKCRSPLL